jgi:hypothetical protein
MVLVRKPQTGGGGSTDFSAKRFMWGPAQQLDLAGPNQSDTTALNDADNSVAAVYMAHKDGVINQVGLAVTAKAGSSTTVLYNIGVVTVDASGLPTSTPYGGSALEQRSVSALAVGWVWITLATPAAVAAGDLIAVRIWPEGTVPPDVSNNVTVRHVQRVGALTSYSLPYAAVFTASWAKSGSHPIMTYRMNDGAVAPHGVITAGVTNTSFNSGTDPDEVGAKFQLPWGAICRGARVPLDVATQATNSFQVKLYDGANVLLASATVPAATVAQGTLCHVDVWWDPVTLSALTDYRLTVLALTTDGTQMAVLTTPDTDSKEAFACGDRFGLTQRADAGAWTDTPLTVPLVGVWLEGLI